jgi:UDP-glucose 4-epimerase
MANILVTGGCGFIGSNLVDMLVEHHNVVVVDNLDTGKKENCNKLANYIFDDIRSVFKDVDSLNPLLANIDVVFHLAALARIQPSFNRPVETMNVNTGGTILICEFARKVGAKVVYAGSSSFYAGQHLNPYAFSKWQGEEVCKLYSEVYGLSTSIARFFNVYGPRHLRKGPYATVIGIFEDQMIRDVPLTVTGDGEQRRDFTNVADICDGLIKMSNESWSGEIFNLGTGTNYSINELALMFKDDIEYIPKRPGEAWITLADIEKTTSKLNWLPSAKLKDYVKNWKENNV